MNNVKTIEQWKWRATRGSNWLIELVNH